MIPVNPSGSRPGRRVALGILWCFAAGAAFAASPPPAAPGAPGAGGGPSKPYTLYLGADFAIELDGQLRPVQDVQGSSFVVNANGSPVVVSSQSSDLRIKIDDQLKLTATAATIAHLKADRVYTPENDPRAKFGNLAAAATGYLATADLAHGAMVGKQVMAGMASAAAAATAGSPNAGAFAAAAATAGGDAAAAEAEYQQSLGGASNESNLMVSLTDRMQMELAEKRFDAFELTFDLSSPRPLDDAYMIVTVRYREKADRPDKARLWVYAQKLPRIDARPQKIRLGRGGFPPGYELEDYRVHLYENGSEIATTASRKQVALTADEAFLISVADYPGRNRDQTLAPVPARTFWPADLRARVPAARLSQIVYVQVGKDGKPRGAFLDKTCAHPLADAQLDGVVADLRFFPALASGKPVEGVAAVRLE